MGFQKGHKLNIGNQYAKGGKHTDEWKQQARLTMLGNTRGFIKGKPSPRKGKKSTKPAWNKGLKLPERSGLNHPLYVKDRSKLVRSEKKHLDGRYREWMRAVKTRDGWTCRIANINCKGRLEAHHILSWQNFPELRYEINNGITLCVAHHPRKRKDEVSLAPFFLKQIDSTISLSNFRI